MLKSTDREILEILQAKGVNIKCPACGCETISVPNFLLSPVEVEEEYDIYTKVSNGKVTPQVQVICSNCGYTRSFSTLVLKIK